MAWFRSICIALGALVLLMGTAHSQSSSSDDNWAEINKLHWQFDGPGHIGSQATIHIPTATRS